MSNKKIHHGVLLYKIENYKGKLRLKGEYRNECVGPNDNTKEIAISISDFNEDNIIDSLLESGLEGEYDTDYKVPNGNDNDIDTTLKITKDKEENYLRLIWTKKDGSNDIVFTGKGYLFNNSKVYDKQYLCGSFNSEEVSKKEI